ncbi:MAG: phosphoribosylaminoimidazolesuccinocarboxamide synthase [Phycisphaerales bacterium]|jgi:phosphoribosylaminoimidazole-succinocarboxamide synthase|nr:phosphoribosylaminoimidazolesuccinocarboxamide synthase [Phycisphaerales bacterium]
MKTTALLTTSLDNYPKRTGKVRDLYELSDALLMVATDRISAYDVVMPNGIPDKGRVLTQISVFWFDLLGDTAKNHLISSDVKDLPEDLRDMEELEGRIMLCRKAQVVPIECIVRGYIAGSGWREYKKSGTICSMPLESGLKQGSKLPEPIFTPSTKAEQGLHDENVSFEVACDHVGEETMNELRDKSIAIYQKASEYASERGIILADTKFEWGRDENGEMMLIDEVLTPDSSRFWPVDGYSPGKSQPSFDKQFVRDYLDRVKFDRTPPGPPLPAEIVQQTREKYIEAYTCLTGKSFAWE